MNKEIRTLFETVLAVYNNYENVPIEAKRLIAFIVLQMIEKQADEAINKEYMLTEDSKDAEGIFENKLGELSK